MSSAIWKSLYVLALLAVAPCFAAAATQTTTGHAGIVEAIVPLDASYVAPANDREARSSQRLAPRDDGAITSHVFAFARSGAGPTATLSPARLGYSSPIYAYDYFNNIGIFLRTPEDRLD